MNSKFELESHTTTLRGITYDLMVLTFYILRLDAMIFDVIIPWWWCTLGWALCFVVIMVGFC
jgi:hypothetical protein